MSDIEIDGVIQVFHGKDWPTLDRQERLAVMDLINKALMSEMQGVEEELNAMLKATGVPLTVDIKVNIGVTDNRQDPRLP